MPILNSIAENYDRELIRMLLRYAYTNYERTNKKYKTRTFSLGKILEWKNMVRYNASYTTVVCKLRTNRVSSIYL